MGGTELVPAATPGTRPFRDELSRELRGFQTVPTGECRSRLCTCMFNRVETIPSKKWGADKAVRGQGTTEIKFSTWDVQCVYC